MSNTFLMSEERQTSETAGNRLGLNMKLHDSWVNIGSSPIHCSHLTFTAPTMSFLAFEKFSVIYYFVGLAVTTVVATSVQDASDSIGLHVRHSFPGSLLDSSRKVRYPL